MRGVKQQDARQFARAYIDASVLFGAAREILDHQGGANIVLVQRDAKRPLQIGRADKLGVLYLV